MTQKLSAIFHALPGAPSSVRDLSGVAREAAISLCAAAAIDYK
jgi:hypothetical protein